EGTEALAGTPHRMVSTLRCQPVHIRHRSLVCASAGLARIRWGKLGGVGRRRFHSTLAVPVRISNGLGRDGPTMVPRIGAAVEGRTRRSNRARRTAIGSTCSDSVELLA